MKTIYKSLRNISLALCATMAISSCDSFLDTKPYDFVAPQTFYTNESECTMALAGVYYTLVYEQTYGNYYSCMISNVDDLSYYQQPATYMVMTIALANNISGGHGKLYIKGLIMPIC